MRIFSYFISHDFGHTLGFPRDVVPSQGLGVGATLAHAITRGGVGGRLEVMGARLLHGSVVPPAGKGELARAWAEVTIPGWVRDKKGGTRNLSLWWLF